MRKLTIIILTLLLLLLVGAAGAVCLDHYLSRPDRIAATRRVDEMIWVRDQLLRYEFEHDVLPRTLTELVGRYVRQDQLSDAGGPLYRYEPTKRLLAQVRPSVVHGLRTYELPPTEMVLPLPDVDAPRSGRPTVEVSDLLSEGVALLPSGPGLPEPPPGALVFEAEHYTDTNYGWEVHPDPACSGGAYLHCWEGMTNGPAQIEYSVGDFWDVRATRELTRLRYHFRVPKAGEYYVYGRMWTTDTHCSNSINVGIDAGGPDVGWMGNRTPFRWVWTPVSQGDFYLSAGDHFLHVFIHEDGIRLDQFILSPRRIEGGRAYRANLLPGKGTAWEKTKGPPVHVSFDLKSMVISPGSPPECKVVLRRLRECAGEAVLRVTLLGAALEERDWRVVEHRLDLARLPEVCFVPLSFSNLDLSRLPRREYLLRAELISAEETIASARVTLLRPFVWEACGPFLFMRNDYRGPLDGTREPKEGDKHTWKPFEVKSMDHFGVLDFGLHTTGSSLHAPQDKTIYARTRIQVPKSDTYLFLIQTDDYMLLWLDGKLVYRYEDMGYYHPVTRSARRLKVPLEAGEHRLRMRVNQTITRWQASVRIRTADDDISSVVGLPLPTGQSPDQ